MKQFMRAHEFTPHADDEPSVSTLAEGGAVFRVDPRGRVSWVHGGIHFSDNDVDRLLALPELIEFNLLHFTNIPPQFTDHGFRWLVQHPRLQAVVDQNNPCLTDATADYIAKARQIRWVKLPNCAITDRGVEALSGASQILGLSLISNPISDQSVPALCRLTSLRNLWVGDTAISPDGVRVLAESLKRCKVHA